MHQAHLVRAQGANDLPYWDLFFSSVRIHHEDRVFIELCAQRVQFQGFFLVTGFSGSDLGFEAIDLPSLPRIGGGGVHFKRANLQSRLLDVRVNRADLDSLDPSDLLMKGIGAVDQWGQGNPSSCHSLLPEASLLCRPP